MQAVVSLVGLAWRAIIQHDSSIAHTHQRSFACGVTSRAAPFQLFDRLDALSSHCTYQWHRLARHHPGPEKSRGSVSGWHHFRIYQHSPAHAHGMRDLNIRGYVPWQRTLWLLRWGKEKKRQAVNEWIRKSGAFDGVISRRSLFEIAGRAMPANHGSF